MISEKSKFCFGTSGWSYKEWIGPLYTKEDKSMLRAYAKVFSSVEIDSTFYRYPTKGMAMGWTRYTPDDFVFAAKLPKLITHEKKLDLNQGVEQDLQRFIDIMEPVWLCGKLGCILIQLPPSLKYCPKEIEDFFKIMPKQVRFAVEFRHLSWMRSETWQLLEKYNVAYTIVDEPLLPPEAHVTSDIAYFRWHGRGTRPWYDYQYKLDELKPWVPKMKEAEPKVKRVFGFFNNHFHGYAVENCLQVLEMLGVLTALQKSAKSKVETYLNSAARTRESKLDTFIEPRRTDFEQLLSYFAASGRLERAREISDDELAIKDQTDTKIQAEIRQYHIIIDKDERTILHDCADWNKMRTPQRFCKHVAKLLLALDREVAMGILQDMYDDPEKWHFRSFTG